MRLSSSRSAQQSSPSHLLPFRSIRPARLGCTTVTQYARSSNCGPTFRACDTAGLQLLIVGLGPAAVIETWLTLDGGQIGKFDESGVNKVRDKLTTVRPAAVTLGGNPFLATDYNQFLLRIERFDPDTHLEFVDLIRDRLAIEIHYESVYGGEVFTARHPQADVP